MENVFQQCVAEARDRGATVLLSSHILAETEALCDRVTIIRAGRTVESGTLDSMRHLSRTSIKAEMIGDPGDLSRIKGVEDVSIDGHTLRAQVDGDSLGEVIRVLGDAGRPQPGQPATHAGGAVPAPLRHRSGAAARRAGARMTVLDRPHRPAHRGAAARLELLGNPWAASALPAPRPHRAAAVGAAAVGPAGTVYVGSIEAVYPTQADRAASPRRSWPAPPSARCTATSTTTASAPPASGRPACSTC